MNREMVKLNSVAETDCVVVGAGPVGMTAALAISKAGFSCLLIGPEPKADSRTTALLQDSVDLLNEVEVWAGCESKAFPLSTMRLVDGSKRLIRAPECAFHASELNLSAFGYNIRNEHLNHALIEQVEGAENITWAKEQVSTASFKDEGAVVSVASGAEYTSHFCIAADGRHSLLREAAQIDHKERSFPQIALVGEFSHTKPHGDASTEFHTESGPFTLVPLEGNSSSVVWVVRPEDAPALIAEDLERLGQLLTEKSQGLLGICKIDEPLRGYPLSTSMASQFGTKNLALIGEAAHVFPPIGAQGMNLGMRDIRDAVSMAKHIKTNGSSFNSFGETYHRQRRADIQSRTSAVNSLNRSLLTDWLPVHLARGLSLFAMNKVPFLRKQVMERSLASSKVS